MMGNRSTILTCDPSGGWWDGGADSPAQGSQDDAAKQAPGGPTEGGGDGPTGDEVEDGDGAGI